MTKKILFIMCDQLRWDYLSCAGHPHLHTPNIDKLASRGIRFSNAFCQTPLCGPSRASFYTGRYPSSHGVRANKDPLKIGERTLGNYLREHDIPTILIGKSEASANIEGMKQLGIDRNSQPGRLLAQDGFEEFDQFTGVYPNPIVPAKLSYNEYLKKQGFEDDNPWESFANTAIDESGNLVSGWQMRHAHLAARIPEPLSETAYTTDLALKKLKELEEEQSWCLHLSYIKPHWPYLAPSPYHQTYSSEHVTDSTKVPSEKNSAHPVYRAFMEQSHSKNFSRESIRRHVIPTYMGLIKQIDDHLGRIFNYLEKSGLMQETLIIFTSDHGDYLGDHWLGEKDLYHESSVRIPMIISDPSQQADSTRGTVLNDLIESIDLLPTILSYCNLPTYPERLEGQSLLDTIRNVPASTTKKREYVISEMDYSDRGPRQMLDLHPYQCRATMIRSNRWKYILHEQFRPQLYDMENDPNEFFDLGQSAEFQSIRDEYHEQLFIWFRNRLSRTEIPLSSLHNMGPERDEEMGIMIGHW